MENKTVKSYIETIHFCPRYNHHWTDLIDVTDKDRDPTKYHFYNDHGCVGYRCFDIDAYTGVEQGKSHWIFFEDRLAAAMDLMGWNPGIATDDEIITAVAKTA